MTATTLTIGRLAREAGVGVETIRYYQKRDLLPVPDAQGAFRHYPRALVDRIHFIKRSQELGFTLDEIAQLLSLEKGGEREAIRSLAQERLTQIELKLADLQRMQKTLSELVSACKHADSALPCPIISALS